MRDRQVLTEELHVTVTAKRRVTITAVSLDYHGCGARDSHGEGRATVTETACLMMTVVASVTVTVEEHATVTEAACMATRRSQRSGT